MKTKATRESHIVNGCAALSILLLQAGCTAPAEQSVREVPVTIAVDTVLAIGMGLPSGNPVLDADVVRDAEGRYWVAPTTDPGAITIFDGDGTRLRSVGRQGNGPGEFQNVDRVFRMPGDSVAVADGLRVTVFTPDQHVARSFQVNGRVHTAVIWRDRLLLNTNNRTGASRAVQVLNPSGTVERTFGARTVPHDLFAYPRFIALQDSSIWAAREFEYTLEEYDSNGHMLREIVRRPEWFPGVKDQAGWRAANRQGSVSRVVGLHAAPLGSLWVATLHINTAPYQSGSSRQRDARPEIPDMKELDRFYEHRLDLLNVNSGVVSASIRLPPFGGFIDSTHVYTYDQASDGNWYIRVLNLRVKRLPE